MKPSLAILVNSDRHMEYVTGITLAAHAKGKAVSLFFTGKGVRLIANPAFQRLVGRAAINVCDISYRSFGLRGSVDVDTHVEFTTQSMLAQLLNRADRYLVF